MDPHVHGSNYDVSGLTTAELLDMKSRLEDELQSLMIGRSAAEQVSVPGDVEELQKRVQDLQEQLLEESNARSASELFIAKIQKGETICDAMFGGDGDADRNSLIKWSLEELELMSQIKRIQKETLELQEKYEKQITINLQLKNENQEMIQKLKNRKDKARVIPAEVANNQEYKRLKRALEMKCQSVEIARNIIPLLICASGIDSTCSANLHKVVLECEEPLNL